MATTDAPVLGDSDFALARSILNGQDLPSSDQGLNLVKRLRNKLGYKYAREISWRYLQSKPGKLEAKPGKLEEKRRFEFLRVLVTSIYKDLELPAERSLPQALDTLVAAGYDPDNPPESPFAAEALGLAGAIHKRMWEHDGEPRHLERALHCYQLGYGDDVTTDSGYQAINAAYILDLLASLEAAQPSPADGSKSTAEVRQDLARAIRQDLVNGLPALKDDPSCQWVRGDWWYHATVAEAFFGLGDYENAQAWIREGLTIGVADADRPGAEGQTATDAAPAVEDWQYESTAHQLASLARIQGRVGPGASAQDSPAWRAVAEAFGRELVSGVHSSFVGKIGLALSGGGFRASLYHIGVLARLAELDVLRSVEVLSCVSGGSIVGARYYLEVRRLLQQKRDADIVPQDYVEIVRRIATDFLAGVQTNIRNRLLSEFGTAMRDAFQWRSVRTERLGELFEEELYRTVPDGEGDAPRWLDRLAIEPVRSAEDRRPPGQSFSPRLQNWRRQAKAPILVLNATTLNTGHTWQFTSSWMGEPPGGSDPRVDSTTRLRRVRYSDAPKAYRSVRLGHAVAASACVPGLFDPLALPGLYPGTTVHLVDGGVHDNQGTATLLEQGCTVLLVSDASGHLTFLEAAETGKIGVPLRANNVLMARVREVQYRLLRTMHEASVLRGLMYVHLKQDLDAEPRDWAGCQEPNRSWSFDRIPPQPGALTSYGMRKDVQHRVASLRTDLDAFSDREAFALMESGYRASRHAFPRYVPTFPLSRTIPEEDWPFHCVRPLVTGVDGRPEDYARVCEHLREGEKRFFRASRLARGVAAAVAAPGRMLFKPGAPRKTAGQRALSFITGALGSLPLRLSYPFATRAWLRSGRALEASKGD